MASAVFRTAVRESPSCCQRVLHARSTRERGNGLCWASRSSGGRERKYSIWRWVNCATTLSLPEALQLTLEVVGEIPEELLGMGSGLLGQLPILLCQVLGATGASGTNVREHRRRQCENCEQDAAERDGASPPERMARCARPHALLFEYPLGRLARLALVALIAACLYYAADDVVCQLDPAHVEPLLDAQ